MVRAPVVVEGLVFFYSPLLQTPRLPQSSSDRVGLMIYRVIKIILHKMNFINALTTVFFTCQNVYNFSRYLGIVICDP